ncbi:MAG: DUF427 domain-containing protein [Gammaproteobacteria bacterium]
MPRAIWNGAVIAASGRCERVEGNDCFPPDGVQRAGLKPSDSRTLCSWKGTASYHHAEVSGQQNTDAAWYYADPKPAAANIRGHIAFWRGVRIEA